MDLTFRQHKQLEKMRRQTELTARALEFGGETVGALGSAARGLFSNQIAGTVAFALILGAAYGLQPTRDLMANLAQGIAKGIGDGWRQSIAPELCKVPGLSIFCTTPPPKDAPPPSEGEAPNCIQYWVFYLLGKPRTFNNKDTAVSAWDTDHVLYPFATGDLLEITRCTFPDGHVDETSTVIKESGIF